MSLLHVWGYSAQSVSCELVFSSCCMSSLVPRPSPLQSGSGNETTSCLRLLCSKCFAYQTIADSCTVPALPPVHLPIACRGGSRGGGGRWGGGGGGAGFVPSRERAVDGAQNGGRFTASIYCTLLCCVAGPCKSSGRIVLPLVGVGDVKLSVMSAVLLGPANPQEGLFSLWLVSVTLS